MENTTSPLPDTIGSPDSAPAEKPAAEDAQQKKVVPLQTESELINFIEGKNTDWILLVGPKSCGKTSIISSIIHYLSEMNKSLGEMKVVRHAEDKRYERTNVALDEVIKDKMEKRIFPGRTMLGSLNHVNIQFNPNSSKPSVSFTFLDVAGEYFKEFKEGKISSQDFKDHVDVYFKTDPEKVRMSFVLVTSFEEAAETDILLANFLDYIVWKDERYKNAKILLLISKWDEYQGGKSVQDFTRDTMKSTWKKIGRDGKLASFSLGKIDKIVAEDEGVTENRGFIVRYDEKPAKKVFRWLYHKTTGKHLQPWWQRLFG